MATAQQFDQAERNYEAAWLAREEDGDDDDLLTEDEAREQAEEENERTPAHFANWLAEAADNPHKDRTPADLQALRERWEDGETLTPGQWLALLVAGCDADVLRAAHALRELFRAAPDSEEFVKGRAAEILAAQAEQEEGAHYDRLAEMREAA